MADFAQVGPILSRALESERTLNDPVAAVFGAAAEGVARAAAFLARTYTLIATNVPYLTRSKQNEVLKQFCDAQYADSKRDLATAFLERCRTFAVASGSYALVTPQNWLFLDSYKNLRRHLLKEQTWNQVSRLGPSAFDTISGEIVNVALSVLTQWPPPTRHMISGIDATEVKSASQKANVLRNAKLILSGQSEQINNPDARIVMAESSGGKLLSEYAVGLQGIATGDYPRFGRCFWELPLPHIGWEFQQSTVQSTVEYGGREHILFWENGHGALAKSPQARTQGFAAFGKRGVAISQMSGLPSTLYTGELFDNNTAVILPKKPQYLPAIWAFCRSTEFALAIRRIDPKLNVTNATLVKVPFSLGHSQEVADDAGPLPDPSSNDPTQWLFSGNPVGSTEPLQVAVARLLGYRWPQQESDSLDGFADDDGIAALVPAAGEISASERLRALLAAAYRKDWSATQQARLLQSVGFAGKSLDEWLRDGFFSQHSGLSHNRPFIWHIWDGRKDGFSALVNYHKLDLALLNRLIYTYLGSWIALQRAERDSGVAGADGRLVAALDLQKKLERIRDGEPPYDIYVRWKPIYKQPIGWEPDLNDGVRLNIRPFVTAGILRSKFTINWNKDRGTNPDGSERLNDLHFTIAEKQDARRVEV